MIEQQPTEPAKKFAFTKEDLAQLPQEKLRELGKVVTTDESLRQAIAEELRTRNPNPTLREEAVTQLKFDVRNMVENLLRKKDAK